jgi:hypothetical protein
MLALLLLASLAACTPSDPVAQAEAVIDAFYGWDPVALAATVDPSEDTDRLLYYQAWARAAHYTVATRRPCELVDAAVVECRITVHDDFGAALGYVATDTFRMIGGPERIAHASFEGDDPPVVMELFAWIADKHPEVMSGPCLNLFDGGTTPAECARAVVAAARAFDAPGKDTERP